MHCSPKQENVHGIQTALSEKETEFKFDPKSQKLIKSVKYLIKRLVGSSILIFKRINTNLKQTEAIVNSQPLFTTSNDPND